MESKKKMYLKFEKEKKKKGKREKRKKAERVCRKNFIALMPGTNRCSYYLLVSVKHVKSTF